MPKFLLRFLAMMLFCGIVATGCSDDNNEVPVPEAPTVSVKLDKVTRTEVAFTISADNAVDYAYMILPSGESVSDAESLFREGNSGILEDGKAVISYDDITGGSEYALYVAVRRINPYVYSELVSVPLSTDIAYTSLITMDAIGLTSYSYHIEMPQGAKKAKHVSIAVADYEGIARILANLGIELTHESYLETFGYTVEESTGVTIDKRGETALGDVIGVYPSTDFMVIAGVVSDDGKLDPASVETLLFRTKEAIESPYDIDVEIREVSSTGAVVSVSPAEGFVSYRMLVAERVEFDNAEAEGYLDQLIIGDWMDESREYTEAREFEISGLVPNSSYVAGVVGFDAENRQKRIIVAFTTGEPTGPAPEISIEGAVPEGMKDWCEGAVNVKVKNAAVIYSLVAKKTTFDEVLSRPGVTLADVIVNNGSPLSDADFAEAMKPEGFLLRTGEVLSPDTEYTIGIYARSDEYLVAAGSYTFKTGLLPQQGGDVRINLPGTYTAETSDINGNSVSFTVTVATGVNEATVADYSAKNRLVCIGFGPESGEYKYTSPEQLVEAGYSESEANLNYGPKWFIEFGDGDDIHVVPAVNSSYEFDYNMGKFGDNTLYFWGFARKSEDRYIGSGNYQYPVEVSADYNTVTVNPYKMVNAWTGVEFQYYPAMTITSSTWSDGTPVFQTSDKIVMTRKIESNASVRSTRLAVPERVTVTVGDKKLKYNNLNAAAERIIK